MNPLAFIGAGMTGIDLVKKLFGGGGDSTPAAGGGGLDKNLLALLGMGGGMDILGALLGGEEGPNSFADAPEEFRGMVDPVMALHQARTGTARLGEGMTERAQAPIHLRSAFAQDLNPISSPGIPFDFGAGFGSDPALSDPSLLMNEGTDLRDPFQGLGFTPEERAATYPDQGAAQPPTPPGSGGIRRRKPGFGGEIDDSEDMFHSLRMMR